MTWTPIDTIFFVLLIITAAISVQFKIRLYVVSGTVMYGLSLNAIRVYRWTLRRIGAAKRAPAQQKTVAPRKGVPAKVSQFAERYKLKGGQSVVGINKGSPIIAKLDDGHTLVSGLTGFGKTVFIHSTLTQWYAQGSRFTSNYEVHLIDLKGNQKDKLHMWAPVVDGFTAVNGDIEPAIAVLDAINKRIHHNLDKAIILIIDEAANLTAFAPSKNKRRGNELLGKIASQMRVNGALICVTQYARHDVIGTLARHNLARRICFPVRELAHARSAMAVSNIKQKQIPANKGDFIMLDTGSTKIVSGRTVMPADGEIKEVIDAFIEGEAQSDGRMGLYWSVARHLERGQQVRGVNAVSKTANMSTKLIMYHYRNFLAAGAFRKGKNNAHYMALPFGEGWATIKRYIREERWMDEPEKG